MRIVYFVGPITLWIRKMAQLILASGSPRRRELLSALGLRFQVVPSSVDETLAPELSVSVALEELAVRKAAEVQARGAEWVLAADTSVVLGGTVFGKPGSRGEACEMLRALSGRTHSVVTGVALLGVDSARTFSVETAVTFRQLTARQISWYAALDEPYDKAGAYAIQGRGAFLVESIRGSYTNVVGLPMAETVDALEAAGLLTWTGPDTADGCP
jgi:septum formation protein